MRNAEEPGQPPRPSSAPPGSGAENQRPCPDRSTPDDSGAGSSSVPEVLHPVIQNDEVDELERDILDDDLAVQGDPRERARMENASRRLQDRGLVDALFAVGFAGPLFEITVTEFAAYGIAVQMAWMRTGEIVRQCKARGRPVQAGSLVTGQWSRDDRLEIASETTARALKFFVEDVLKPRRWDYLRGATLKTFFIGSCLLQFPNVFDRWMREQDRWARTHDADAEIEDADTLRRDARWSDPTSETAINRQAACAALDGITDPRTREAARLCAIGWSIAEAGERVGLSPAAVEGRLYRLRKRTE
jgi:hypothetical protein